LVNEGVSEKASQFVKRAIKEAHKNNQEFDAIVYSSGKRVVAVKFKEVDPELKSMATAHKIEGVQIYILCEPLNNYEVVNSKGGGLKMKSYITGGLVNNSIEEDVEQFVRKLVKDAAKDNQRIDGLVYGAGKSASGIKFTE
jgi:ribosomal protein L25 (general stress protein Ctc)